MKAKSSIMSELYLSSGVPFHRDMRTGSPPVVATVNLFQMVSRILHAHIVTIVTDPYAFLMRVAASTEHYVRLVAEYGKSLQKEIGPMVFVSTKEEPRNFVLVSRILEMSISYFNDAISRLENANIFITRAFRDDT